MTTYDITIKSAEELEALDTDDRCSIDVAGATYKNCSRIEYGSYKGGYETDDIHEPLMIFMPEEIAEVVPHVSDDDKDEIIARLEARIAELEKTVSDMNRRLNPDRMGG